jgi:hypothetical protein
MPPGNPSPANILNRQSSPSTAAIGRWAASTSSRSSKLHGTAGSPGRSSASGNRRDRSRPCTDRNRPVVARRMPQHVRVHGEWKLGSPAGSLDHPQEPSGRYRSASFRDEHVRALPLQGPQRSKLGTVQGMDAFDPAFGGRLGARRGKVPDPQRTGNRAKGYPNTDQGPVARLVGG